LETESNRDDLASGGGEPAASSRAAPGGTAHQVFNLQIPADLQQGLASALQRAASSEPETRVKQPVRVELIKDREPTNFEKKTVRIGYWGLVIAFSSLLAASVAAWVVYGQLREMAGQTDLMDIAARQARRDSAEAGVAAARQLRIAQQQADAAQQQVAAVTRQMRVDQRPWIKFELGGPQNPAQPSQHAMPTFFVGQPATVPVNVTNTGKTTAEGIRGSLLVQIVPDGEQPIFPRRLALALPGEPEPRGTNAPPESWFISVLYPSDNTVFYFSRMKADGEFDTITLNEVNELNADTAYIYLVGQVWYEDVFGTTHWTKFCESTDHRKPTSKDSPVWRCAKYGAVDNN
jgi:hypothetical protein